MSQTELPTLQRQHRAVADHARQAAVNDLEVLKGNGIAPGLLIALFVVLLILMTTLLKREGRANS